MIDGPGRLLLESDAGKSIIDVRQGGHEIRVPVALRSDAEIRAESGSSVLFSSKLDLNGKGLFVRGPGEARIGKSFEMHGGVLTLDGLAPLVFSAEAEPVLDGILHFSPNEGVELSTGRKFRLLDGLDCLQSKSFLDLQLPSLKDGLEWETSKLYSEGTIMVVSKSK
jgi:hypothetical protein